MTKFIFTCEHGGNIIPTEFKKLFKAHSSLLNTHRAYDLGILDVFKNFAKYFDAPSYYSEISRLLVELNRSPNHKNLFSEITKQLDTETKQFIINNYYLPYRTKVEENILGLIKKKHRVIHISFHSFTSELNGISRNTDIGLLYNPKIYDEKEFCKNWKKQMLILNPNLKIRFNYPYLGIADGFTSYLRKNLDNKFYCGIELEINQTLLRSKTTSTTDLMIRSLKSFSV